MNELLANEAVQTALVVVIVTGLNALAAWVKGLTKTGIVNEYWSYVQPVADAVMKEVAELARKAQASESAIKAAVSRGVVQFADTYAKHEGAAPTVRQLNAVEAELQDAAGRVFGDDDD